MYVAGEGGYSYYFISSNISEVHTKILKRTNQETSLDGPVSINRAVHFGINC